MHCFISKISKTRTNIHSTTFLMFKKVTLQTPVVHLISYCLIYPLLREGFNPKTVTLYYIVSDKKCTCLFWVFTWQANILAVRIKFNKLLNSHFLVKTCSSNNDLSISWSKVSPPQQDKPPTNKDMCKQAHQTVPVNCMLNSFQPQRGWSLTEPWFLNSPEKRTPVSFNPIVIYKEKNRQEELHNSVTSI